MAMMQDNQVTDFDSAIPRSIPELCFFERLGPVRNEQSAMGKEDRFERLRRGARDWDMSQSVAAGDLVVMAQADDSPLPYPFAVDGDVTGGKGTIFYQVALPLDRSLLNATTRPSARNNEVGHPERYSAKDLASEFEARSFASALRMTGAGYPMGVR